MKKLDFDIYPVVTEKFCRNGSSIETLKELVKAGIKIVQLREKEYPKKKILEMAYEYREITLKNNIIFIINDHIDIALAVEADGVHLGQEDMPCSIARKLLPGFIIGISAHDLKEALQAEEDGASYVNIGPVFFTKTKTTCQPLGPEMVKSIGSKIHIPFTVMGGIKEENISLLVQAGAKKIAMITEVTMNENIPEKIQKLKSLLV